MSAAEELVREAHFLGDEIRRLRASGCIQARGEREAAGLAAMEARLRALWVAIRAARASGLASGAPLTERRTRPKWE
jgi:hypothetical protein